MCYNNITWEFPRAIHMRNKIKLLYLIIILGIIFNTPSFVFGGNNGDDNTEINKLNNEIQSRKNKMDELKNKQKEYDLNIQEKRQEKASLSNEMALLENKIAKSELDIESAEIDIDRVNLEIKKVNLEIEEKNKKIEDEKSHIEDVLKLMYKEDGKSDLEIILLNDSLTDFINQTKYLKDINSEIGSSLNKLKLYKEDLDNQNKDLLAKKKDLNGLKADLEEKKLALESEQENKTYILEQTKSSEYQYQKLLKLSKQEQEEAAAEIADLEKTVREKMSQKNKQTLVANTSGFMWPVPKNIITALFHDPDYPFRYIFEHAAVDIRTGQGTALRASASGYVARAKDGGKKGYSYIMLIHADGLATVYGHVSAIYVKEDEYVTQGQIIGKTGGMPGTPGAGPLTTGPHLHFEIRLNGIPVNPLQYLP